MSEQLLTFTITRFVRYETGSVLKAFCDVAVGEHCLIRGVRVISGRGDYFVSLPRQLGRNGKWYDSVVLLSKEARDGLAEVVLRTFHQHATGETLPFPSDAVYPTLQVSPEGDAIPT